VRVTARKDHQISGGEPVDGAVVAHEFAFATRDVVHAAQPRLVEADPERRAEFEPSVAGALEA
jgi:hypothetical protein